MRDSLAAVGVGLPTAEDQLSSAKSSRDRERMKRSRRASGPSREQAVDGDFDRAQNNAGSASVAVPPAWTPTRPLTFYAKSETVPVRLAKILRNLNDYGNRKKQQIPQSPHGGQETPYQRGE